MYLYHYILIGTSVLSMCYAESASNHAMSSQSHDRGDVSLSYKFNLIHIYTTSKPHRLSRHNYNQKHHIRALPQKPQHANYQNIQYAPLFLRPSQQSLNPQKESQKAEVNTEIDTSVSENELNNDKDSQQRQEQKRNLFPHIAVTESSDARFRNYVPGYNVDLQAVNNKLNQNGIYANNPNFLVKNKQVNVNHLQPQSTTENRDVGQEVPKTKDAKTKGTYSMLTYPQDVKKHNEDIKSGGQKNKRPFFYVKAPKVQLNLARALHIARTVHKASVNVNSSFRTLPSLPYEFFSNTHIVHPPKTQLHPVQNSKVYMVHHTV